MSIGVVVGSPAGGANRSIETELAEVAGHLNIVNARLVRLAERVLTDGEWEGSGMRSPANYLAMKVGLSPERAKVIINVAAHRSEFPVVVSAFDRGALSLEQVAEAVEAPAWADAMIADFVSIAPVTKLRRAMRSNMFEGESSETGSEPVAQRDRVSFGIGRDGRWRIRGELGLDEGRRVEAALTERKDAMFADGDESVTMSEAFVSCFDRSLGFDGGTTDTWNLVCLCPKHHRMHHQGALGITGNADEFGGITFTDAAGKAIGGVDPPRVPSGAPPSPPKPYEPPLVGRFDWNWIGLGWIHPKERDRQLEVVAKVRDAA